MRFAVLVLAVPSLPLAAAEGPDFLREVRPVLSTYCFKCHGPDDKTREGGLRLDVREEALKPGDSGKAALVPGDPDASELMVRILSTDEDEVMPPPSARHEMNAVQKDLLKRWIAAGAEYKPHWAWVAPVAGEPPQTAAKDWARTPVDHFILARLEKENLKPSGIADRLTIARRLWLDLTGLPPTPEEADAFAADPAPDAVERLVDQLLASPHYGERWARKWMDLARYSDTNGFEKDRYRSIWPWRDWVVAALNADMPFDQFTVEQLAGDMLPGATEQQVTATGFHRNTMLNEEGGIDPLEFRWLATVDRVNTTGTTWLGLTVGCAQCHTHKFDPILHTEYYQMMAFLNNADEPELPLHGPDAAKRAAERAAEADRLEAALADHWPVQSGPVEWSPPAAASARTRDGSAVNPQSDQSFVLSGTPAKEVLTIELTPEPGKTGALRLETLTDPSLPATGPGRTPHGNFVLSDMEVKIVTASGAERAVPLTNARADVEQDGFAAAGAIDGDPATAWAVDARAQGKPLNALHWLEADFAAPQELQAGEVLRVRLVQTHGGGHTIGRPRILLGRAPAAGAGQQQAREAAVEAAFQKWLAAGRAAAVPWSVLRPSALEANVLKLFLQPDNSIFAGGDTSKNDIYDLTFSEVPAGTRALRLEALPDARLPANGPGTTYYEGPEGDFFLGEITLTDAKGPVKIATASHSHAKNHFSGGASAQAAADGQAQTGWTSAGRAGERDEAVFVLERAVAGPLKVSMQFGRHYASSLGRFRLSAAGSEKAAASVADADVQELLAQPETALTDAGRASLRKAFLTGAPELSAQVQKIRGLRKASPAATTLVLRERPADNPRVTRLHHRGEYLQPKDPVEPGVPAFLPAMPPDAPKNRLEFARWLVRPDHPLTARVTVNRAWAAFFGTGLVKTLDDFGFQSEVPSHPELLDWLAVEFVKGCPSLPGAPRPWSLKRLHKLMVLSAAYLQKSEADPAHLERDPANRLLARGPSFRMDAEILRDAALQAAGLLSAKAGGPSVRPPQPSGVTEVAYGGGGWTPSEGEDRYRRSLYTYSKRTAPFAAYTTFDAPSGEACLARRDVSNTPLQALTLLNDVLYMEAAQALGKNAAAQPGDDAARLAWMFRRILIRPAAAAELEKLQHFVSAQRARIASGGISAEKLAGPGAGDTAGERALWTAVARVLLSLHETVARP